MAVHIVRQSVTVGGVEIPANKTQIYSAGGGGNIDEPCADSATTDLTGISIDISALKSILIVSDQDVTLKTNDSSSPDDTINLLADVPYIWNEGSYHPCLLTIDVTSFHVTNASGASARFQADWVVDVTP